MESDLLERLDIEALRALLAWQVELGADEAIGDVPVDCRTLPAEPPWKARPGGIGAALPATTGPAGRDGPAAVSGDADPVALARAAAAGAGDLATLRAALEAFEGCEVKKGARRTVFADGNPAAPVMVIVDAPGADEDRLGLPVAGPAGQLLDRMFAAIDLARDGDATAAIYLTCVIPWRLTHNHEARAGDIAMMVPFLERHVELAQPRVLVAMGNLACQALLGRGGLTRLRGRWDNALGLPVLPMLPPGDLLRTPLAKREAWADLLALQARLRDG